MFATLSAAALAFVLTAPTAAAQPGEVTLADGRVLIGTVATKGDVVEVATRSGVVSVAATEVVRIRGDKELRAELRELAKSAGDGAFGQFKIASRAHAFGLTRQMWTHLDACLEALGGDDDSAVGRQFRGLLAQLEPELLSAKDRQADTNRRVHALVAMARPPATPAKRAAIVELLVAEPNADKILRQVAISEPLAVQRATAVAALMRRPERENERFVDLRTVRDKDRDVRRAVAQEIAQHGDARRAVARLALGLMHDAPHMRIRTAQALAELGDLAAVPLLVRAGPYAGVPRAGGGYSGTRAHIFQTEKVSYIRDFDVEIAQAAAVANPIVGTAQRGVVLDARVGGVATVTTQRVPIERAYRRALRRLTQSDPGPDPAAWAAWWAERAPEEPAAAATGNHK